jgi:hypothetical protein
MMLTDDLAFCCAEPHSHEGTDSYVATCHQNQFTHRLSIRVSKISGRPDRSAAPEPVVGDSRDVRTSSAPACVRPDEQFLLDERIRVSDRRGAIDVASIAASQRQQAVADHGGENSLALLLRSTKEL